MGCRSLCERRGAFTAAVWAVKRLLSCLLGFGQAVPLQAGADGVDRDVLRSKITILPSRRGWSSPEAFLSRARSTDSGYVIGSSVIHTPMAS